jgi:8-amino-3,8-dideoxy-alpha-D-manno-octulosonate transaminase
MPGFEVIDKKEQMAVDEVFQNGGILFRHGFDQLRNNCYKVREFEVEFSKTIKAKHALAVNSGTMALRVALAALNIRPGDEVVTQSFTFVATIEAIIESRAVPICAEIDDTLNLDPVDLKKRITPKTKAVIAVHMLGTPARLQEIKAVCDNNGIALIEDTAWGCGGLLQGKHLGTWGRMGTFSFDFAKTMTTGEGGMVVFEKKTDYEKAAAWHDHGHENNPAVPRWEDTRSGSGFNCRMMELQGAIGSVQLRKLPFIIESQRKNSNRIWEAIEGIKGIKHRAIPKESYETADALVVLVSDGKTALECRKELLKVGISTKILPEAYTWHFAGTWSHMPELLDAHGGNLGTAFPQSQEFLTRAVSLPVGVRMNDDIPAKIQKAFYKALS